VLSRRDERGVYVSVAIGSRALDILGVLVDRPGDLVSRGEIMDAVWPGTAVEDSNLNVQVAALRRVLDHDRREGSCIQTVPGRGYRFAVAVERAGISVPTMGDTASDLSDPRNVIPPLPGRQRWYWFGRETIMVAVIGFVLIAAISAAAWTWRSPSTGVARAVPRLSIVVLPFVNRFLYCTIRIVI
jgi:DNA-binding winged helix-turn-helix (wHTH) protein